MRYLKRLFISPWALNLLPALVLIAAALVDLPLLAKLEYPFSDRLQQYRRVQKPDPVVLIATETSTASARGTRSPFPEPVLAELRRLGAQSITLLAPPADSLHAPATRAGETQKIVPPALPSPVPLPPPRALLLNCRNPLAGWSWNDAFRPPPYPDDLRPEGHLIFTPDSDGKIRHLALFLEVEEKLLPALPLTLLLRQLRIDLKQLELIPGELSGSIRADRTAIPVFRNYRLALDLNPAHRAYVKFSAAELLEHRIPGRQLKNRHVLLGPGAAFGDRHLVAGHGFLSTSELAALAASTLLNGTAVQRPHWGWLVEAGVILNLALLFALLMPKLSGRAAAAITLTSLLTWGILVAGSLLVFGIQLKFMPLLLFCLVSFSFTQAHNLYQRDKSLAQAHNRLLLQRFKEQGLYDLALERGLSLTAEKKADKETLYHLGLEFERKRLPDSAVSIYQHLLGYGRFRDTKTRLAQLREQNHSTPGDNARQTTLIAAGKEKPTLGRYRIEQELGQGAMGVLYRGVDPKINRRVAIKTLDYAHIEPEKLETTKKRFFREAEAAGALNHAHIVTIYDIGEDNGLAYLAMELLEGQDLSRFCTVAARLPTAQVVDIGGQIAAALDYAHRHGVVHRDIKPANIILQPDGRIKVVDFGIARVVDHTHTDSGIILGTPSYMSPEQIGGKKIDGRSDLFSLGVLLYELFSGKKPFQGNDLTTLMYNISLAKYPPLKSVSPGLPPDCYRIVAKLLQKTLTRRYRSAAIVARELAAVSSELKRS